MCNTFKIQNQLCCLSGRKLRKWHLDLIWSWSDCHGVPFFPTAPHPLHREKLHYVNKDCEKGFQYPDSRNSGKRKQPLTFASNFCLICQKGSNRNIILSLLLSKRRTETTLLWHLSGTDALTFSLLDRKSR